MRIKNFNLLNSIIYFDMIVAPLERFLPGANQRNGNRSSNYAPVSSVDRRPIQGFNQQNWINYDRRSVIHNKRDNG